MRGSKHSEHAAPKPQIVLDKSFVRAGSAEDVRAICDSFDALMTQDLFVELLRSDHETRMKCFSRFPRRENPVILLPNIGTLMRYEKLNRRPCGPLSNHSLGKRFVFNESLASGEFELNDRQSEGIRQAEMELKQDVEGFMERSMKAGELFPLLKTLRPGQHADRIEELVSWITSDMEGVRRVYAALVPDDFPPAAIVGRTWAVLRWIQVHLLAAVEFHAKYGDGINRTNEEKLENERIDLNYLVFAVLARGLATRDKVMARRFAALAPGGILLPETRREALTQGSS
jgi:hypothetical protein